MSEPLSPADASADLPADAATDAATAPAPAAAAMTPSAGPWRHARLWLGLGWSLLALALTATLILGPLWALGSATGTAWVLALLPRVGVEVLAPQGALLGNFQAQKVTVRWSPTDRVEIERVRWEGLTISFTAASGTWARLHARRLQAEQVRVIVMPTPPTGKPPQLPKQVRLPVEIEVDAVQVGEVFVPGLPSTPFRDVRVAAHLSAAQAPHHRFERISGRFEPLLIAGHARIGGTQPMALDVQLQARQAPANTNTNTNSAPGNPAWVPRWASDLRQGWQAELKASGPLARFNVEASVRAQGQHLDANAWVEPIAPWPLPELHASTRGLDVSALFAPAPATALSGELHIQSRPVPAAAPALTLRTTLTNARPGAWPEHLLPLRSVQAELQAQASRPLRWEVKSFHAQLADGRQSLGAVQLHGKGDLQGFELHAELDALRLGALDARLPAMTLSGPLMLAMDQPPVAAVPAAANAAPAPGKPHRTTPASVRLPPGHLVPSTTLVAPPPPPPHFQARAKLSGRMNDTDRAVQLRLHASGTAERIALHELQAQAGGAQATLAGHAERAAAGWQLEARAALVEFDPRPWLPAGPRVAWPAGAYRINLNGDLALHLPDTLSAQARPGLPANAARHTIDRIASVRGQAQLNLRQTLLAGVPLSGELKLRHAVTTEPLWAQLQLDAGDNRIRFEGQLTPDTVGRDDRFTLQARAPALGQLSPLLRMLPGLQSSGLTEGVSGAVDAELALHGRWPEMSTQGQATVPTLRAGPLHMVQGKLRWQLGSQANAPLDLLAEVGALGWGPQHLAQTRLQLQGSHAAHDLSLRSEIKAAPPVWVERLEGRPPIPAGSPPPRTLINASARGSFTSGAPPDGSPSPARAGQHPFSWLGTLQLLELRTEQAGATPWISTRHVGLEVHSGEALRLVMAAGRAELLTAGLRWDRIEWQPEQGPKHPQRLDLVAELEPLAVATLLRRVQPEFGWGGDLRMGGKLSIKQADAFSADIVLERLSGDLNVTDDSGSQALGLTDLVLALNAQDGVWSFTQGMAGRHLGVAAGAFVVRTTPQRAWPEAQAALQGVFEAKVENLGTWGAWVPTGWRLGGQLRTTASVGGRFGAPEYTGQVQGQNISARNLLEGINIQQGEVDITLQGDTARINQFKAKGGTGSVQLTGNAALGAAPRAQLQLSADKFQLLSRVDRRLVLSGQAQVQLDQDSLAVDGRFDADEALFDLTRLGAPSLGNDVIVTGRHPQEAPAAPSPTAARQRDTRIKLQLGLGEHLILRGRGLDAGLRGDVSITTHGNKQTWNGSVRAVDGSYTAYGQKLSIDRGIITFNGPVNDPRLDITATRPNLDVRVGWEITGTLLNPRVRLFSEPEMSDIDKLSWLMLGRASDGLGRSDTALLQRAAMGMLAGDDPSVSDQVLKTIGLDEVSVRSTDGETKDTVISVGKQISRRWFVGYERGLNATSGSWQLIYRMAQRFTLRAQSGTDQSLDLIWTWRWE